MALSNLLHTPYVSTDDGGWRSAWTLYRGHGANASLITGTEYNQILSSWEEMFLNTYLKTNSRIRVDKGYPDAYRYGYTVVWEDNVVPPVPVVSRLNFKNGVSNAPFRERVNRGEIVMSNYEVCDITVTSSPGAKQTHSSWMRQYWSMADFINMPGFIDPSYSDRYYITPDLFVKGGAPQYAGWYEGVTESFTAPKPFTASQVYGYISAQPVDIGIVTRALAESNRRTLDILTAMAEAPELIKSVLGGLSMVSRLLSGLKNKEIALSKAFAKRKDRLYAQYQRDTEALEAKRKRLIDAGLSPWRLRRSTYILQRRRKRVEREYKEAVRRTGIEFSDALASVWMNFRYNIMPTVYLAQDVWSVLENLGATFFTTRGGKDVAISIPIHGKAIDVVTENRVVLKRSVNSNLGFYGGSMGLVSANFAATAWELVSKSWMVDWVLNIGDFISAFTMPSSYDKESCSYSWRTPISDSVSFDDGCEIHITGSIYSRNIINPLNYASLDLKWDLNAKRYTDSIAVLWNSIRSDLIRKRI